MKNLQLDYIDLLIVHKNDPNCPLEGKNLKFDNMSSGRAQVPNKVSSTMLENSIRALIILTILAQLILIEDLPFMYLGRRKFNQIVPKRPTFDVKST